MKIFLALVAVLLLSVSASAQPRPGAFTTVTATAVSPAAICAGCPIGSTSPAVNSGVTAAALVLPISVPANTTNTLYQGASGLFFGSATSFPIGGLLSVNGFGTHTIGAGGAGGNTLTIRNSTAGTGNFSALFVGNDSNPAQAELLALSSTFTPVGPNVAGGSTLLGAGVGGLSIVASDANGLVRFYSGGLVERMRLLTTGELAINGAASLASSVLNVSADANTQTGVAIKNTSPVTPFSVMDFFNSSNALAGTILQTAATTVAYNTTSDARLKEDLGPAVDLSGLRALRVHDFTWRGDGRKARGLFAQEAYAVFPQAVSPGDDSVDADGHLTRPWGVDYSKVVPDLVAGWQDHDAQIETLTRALEQALRRIAVLESR